MGEAEIRRVTAETEIALRLNTEGGAVRCDSGCGFLDHMLTLFAAHADFGLELTCRGDTRVDYHHSTEDIGICLGRAFAQALGDKAGITRYGDILLPMDEALILCAVDISGRGGCYFELPVPSQKVGDFDTELGEEFFRAFARESGVTLHLRKLAGTNSHHILEGAFKAFGRSLAKAAAPDGRNAGKIPSTKGVLV